MAKKPITHTIELLFGYTDKQGVTHRTVTFGKRLTAGDMMLLDGDPRASSPTQYTDMVRKAMITQFGSLKLPISNDVLLGLNSIDREDLAAAADKFMDLSRDGRSPEYPTATSVELMFGFDIDGITYETVEIGNLLTGRDEVEADGIGLKEGVSRECFRLGRMITKIANSKTTLDGSVALDKFKSLDAEDLNILRIGGRLAELSFRIERDEVSSESDGKEGVSTDAGNTDERTADTGSADA